MILTCFIVLGSCLQFGYFDSQSCEPLADQRFSRLGQVQMALELLVFTPELIELQSLLLEPLVQLMILVPKNFFSSLHQFR
jgi:hypothetical protein